MIGFLLTVEICCCHDGQHFQLDSIELVEARPRASLHDWTALT